MNSLGKPYCSACGYDLTNLTQSNKCPECGKPLIEVLARRPTKFLRWQSKATIAGYPLISISSGIGEDGKLGTPIGFIAIGERPIGVIAIGVIPRGFIAIGSLGIGVFSLGGGAMGLVAFGGLAIGATAFGGTAIGLYAVGGVVMYVIQGFGGLRIPLWP